ncbi:MarR family winged helix-turn-helix transcriptional regulator [Flavobacterium sp. CLA17]|uniref:MarR family winged helix-turn-helix transcriptional regulator n=1 Tax=Flavobacterium sp. CLA17 TaxID=2724135 RepID=UPI0014932468|nr:MarR family winged helix-turn-helix transcriptional regulator [Flavobacterium sp. CLA17]QSB25348.1 winged helix-turn-helix transcriptional regulator [Flavobacterium sp. CLA17]
MKKIFDLEIQNNSLDGKIVAGLERLSQVFRVLLWEKAKHSGLTPLQIQLMIFIKYHSRDKSTVSYLAKEFNLTKATVSDTIKILELKKYLFKQVHLNDSRSFTISLTQEGLNAVLLTENFTDPLYDIVASTSNTEKQILWNTINSIVQQLNHIQIINVQSTCHSCIFFSSNNGQLHCRLMDLELKNGIRLDCADHKPTRLQAF